MVATRWWELLGLTKEPDWAKPPKQLEEPVKRISLETPQRQKAVRKPFDWRTATTEKIFLHLFGTSPDWGKKSEKVVATASDFEWQVESVELDGSESLERAIKKCLKSTYRRPDAANWPTRRRKETRRKKFNSGAKITSSAFELRRDWILASRQDYKSGGFLPTVQKSLRISALPNMLVDRRQLREQIAGGADFWQTWVQALRSAWAGLEKLCLRLCGGNLEKARELALEYSSRQISWFEAAELFEGNFKMVSRLMNRQAKMVQKQIRSSTTGLVEILDYLEKVVVIIDTERCQGQDLLACRAEQSERQVGLEVTSEPRKPFWITEKEWRERQKTEFFTSLNTDFTGSLGSKNPDLDRKFSAFDLSRPSRKVLTERKKQARDRGESVMDIGFSLKEKRRSRRQAAIKRKSKSKFKIER